MAMDDCDGEAPSRVRLSPGEAAFERLKRREALRSKDLPSPYGPRETTESPSTGCSAMPQPATSSETLPARAAPAAARDQGSDESTPRILAVAAAFGFEVAPDLLVVPESTAGRQDDPLPTEPATPASPVIAAAMALGVGAEPGSPRVASAPLSAELLEGGQPVEPPAAAFEALPAAASHGANSDQPALASNADQPASDAPVTASPSAPAKAAAPPPRTNRPVRPPAKEAGDVAATPASGASAGEEAAARLEAALLDQLRSLEETLQPAPVRLPRAEPLRMPRPARPRMPTSLAEPVGAPGRSPFAPDPVRQRTYVDLRDPSPPLAAAATDDAPWRKYLAESPPTVRRSPRPSRPVLRPAAPAIPSPAAIESQRLAGEERGRGFRAMSAAAVLGLGIGLGLLVLVRPFADDPVSVTAAADLSEPAALRPTSDAGARPAPGGPVGDALATLLADAPTTPPVHAGPAVIAEAGTPPEALVVAEAPPAPVAQPRPPLISPPPGQPIPVTRGALYGPDVTLAYGPTVRTYDPVAQSLLRETASEAAAEEADSAPSGARAGTTRPAAIPRDPSRATITSFVNLRAKPDNAAPVVAVLAQGLSVKVIGCDYWCEIEAGGKRGYVFKKFVSR